MIVRGHLPPGDPDSDNRDYRNGTYCSAYVAETVYSAVLTIRGACTVPRSQKRRRHVHRLFSSSASTSPGIKHVFCRPIFLGPLGSSASSAANNWSHPGVSSVKVQRVDDRRALFGTFE